jgi:tetratricopeptide (TPR) repeat protein
VGEPLVGLAPDATAQLAYHALAGEDWPRALHYHMLAGQQAQKLFANHEGIEHFRKALRCAAFLLAEDTVARRQQIHASLGQLLTTTGQYEPALEHLQEALALASTLEDRDAQARACRWIAYVYEFRSEFMLALDWIGRGLEALGERETAVTAELLAITGSINTRQGDYDRALEQCEQSLRIAEKLGDVNALAFAYHARAVVSYRRGNSISTIEDCQKAIQLYEQTGNIHGQAKLHNQIANASFNIGQWSSADLYYRKARDIFNQAGDVHWTAVTDNNLGGLAMNQGRLDEALVFYRESLFSFEQMGASFYMSGILHMNLGAAYVRRNELDTARFHLQTSQEYFEQVQSRDFLPELYRHFAAAALHSGLLPEAWQYGQRALDLARELTNRGEEGNNLRLLAEIAGAQGDLDQAERMVDESLLILEEVGDEYEQARGRLALARIYIAQGHAELALPVIAQATAVLERLDARLDLATARELWAAAGG